MLNQTQTGLRRGWGADWKAQVIPAPAFAAIGLRETSITLSRSGRRLRRMRRPLLFRHKAKGRWQKSGAEDPKKDFTNSISSRQLTLSSTTSQLRGC